ncbi:MAG: class II fructose-bisphosphate aldolase [Parcubacteria group bacterium]|jgi:fructose-bisphosphate aldolase class II
MLASVKDILEEAKNNNYAVGAFNTSNMEVTQAIIRAAIKKNTPVIIQATAKTLDYAGDKVIIQLINAIIEQESASIPIGFHLDHGRDFDTCLRAIELGMKSVMMDASRYDLRENMAMTKRVVDYAHPKGVIVQAELGKVAYLAEMESNPDWDKLMTNPLEAKWLIEETGADALAVSIGNAHGFARERPEPDWARLEEIHKLIPDTPLVLHGASDWVNHKVKEAVKRGIVCFNIDTDIKIAFNRVVCKLTSDRCSFVDPRELLGEAREAVQRVVEEKIDLFRNA